MCKLDEIEKLREIVKSYYTYNCQTGVIYLDEKTFKKVFIYCLKYHVGLSATQIAKIIGQTRSTVSRCLLKFEESLRFDKVQSRELREIEDLIRESV